MRTRSQSREQRPPPPEGTPVVIEPLRIEYPFQEDPTVEPMADTRTMAQLLQAPTEGYEDAILIPEIVANNFELKHGLINLVQNKQFFGHDKGGTPCLSVVDCPDCEDSQFCHSSRVSHPQLHLGIRYPNLID
ncbi:hypothetical protein Tco_1256723 [Tanacetum coccineum]